jgi:two-component system capsular synthesis sensor histidine kinase RcsC
MIGVLPVSLPLDADDAQSGTSGNVYAATLFARDRISASERPSFQPAYDDFWLMRRDGGVLIGGDGFRLPTISASRLRPKA